MARIICIANQKGGVGKTTTAINLAVAFARAEYRTLLIDLDPQCNATSGIGLEPTERHPLVLDCPIHESLLNTDVPDLQLLPGSRSFQDVERLATVESNNRTKLQHHIASCNGLYDYVVIDCPPSLGELTRAALSSSHEVMMPIQCEYFAMEGLSQMIEVIRDVMKTDPGKLQFSGILLTMYNSSLELTWEVDQEVRDFFGEIVFDTVVPRDVNVVEASSHGMSVLDYAPRSRATRAYIELCMEVMDRG